MESGSHCHLNPYLIFCYLLFLACLLILDPASMLQDRQSCLKGWYHHWWEDHFEECTILFSIYGYMFNLSTCSLFISADLICYIGKSIEKSSLWRYWWDGYCNIWCKGVFAANWKSLSIHLCSSPFSILSHHANLALDSQYSSSHIWQKQKNSSSMHMMNVMFQTSLAHISVFVRDCSTHSYLSLP